MFKNILLATDGSMASDYAAQLAVSLARSHGARLTALFVVDPYPYLGAGEATAVGVPAYMAAAYDHAAQVHAKVARLCVESGKAVDLQLLRTENISAAQCIVEVAAHEAADLVVVGSNGRTGLQRLMLDSVAAKVVAACPAPVLVARRKEP